MPAWHDGIGPMNERVKLSDTVCNTAVLSVARRTEVGIGVISAAASIAGNSDCKSCSFKTHSLALSHS